MRRTIRKDTLDHVMRVFSILVFLELGRPLRQIAEEFGVTPPTIRRWLNTAGYFKINDKWTN